MATAASDVPSEALRVQRVVGQPTQALALHLAAASAQDAPNLEFQVHAGIAARQIAHSSLLSVVPTEVHSSTRIARRFFERRTSVTTRARGSPNTPLTCSSARKPVKRYVSDRRRRTGDLAIQEQCLFGSHLGSGQTQQPCGLQADQHPLFTHTTSRRATFVPAGIVSNAAFFVADMMLLLVSKSGFAPKDKASAAA